MRLWTLTIGIAAVLAAGCGQQKAEVVPVEGTLTINGKPMGNVLIQFQPRKWPENIPVLSASAVTDDAGKFVLKAGDGRLGAPPGEHKVTLADNNLATEGEPDTKSGKPPLENRVPPECQTTTKTPLTITVEAGKKQYDVTYTATAKK